MHACLDDLVIALYCFVDDPFGPRLGPGRRPKLSDAELVCLAIAQVLLGFPSERRWLRFAHARLEHLFPYLPGQSGYNRRLRAAGHLLCLTVRGLAVASPSWCDQFRLLDATPIPCAASRQTVKRSALWPHAGYGYCKSHSRWYWGFKLYVLCAPDGMPITWCLATPALGEREVAQALLGDCRSPTELGRIIVCDKGFAGRAFEGLVASLGAAVYGPTARASRAGSAHLGACGSGSRASSTPSRAVVAGAARRPHPWRGVRPGGATAARPGRRGVVQLAARPARQALPSRLRSLTVSVMVWSCGAAVGPSARTTPARR